MRKTDIESVNHVFLFEQHFSCLIIFRFSDYFLAFYLIPIFAFFAFFENTKAKVRKILQVEYYFVLQNQFAFLEAQT